ncbi:MAG: hypothetical protein M3Q55_00845 [Acidobacteriota bacterium]|nr:hypothetical protein [Acidobacteriota bacterium]
MLVDDRRDAEGAVRVLAHHVVDYEDSSSLVQDLRRLRVAARLPRRARVVIWPEAGDSGVTSVDSAEAADGFTPDLWRLRERLRPLVRAGFRVSGAVAPAQAVAALASLGDSGGVVAGLAIDEHAGSLAVVRGGSLVIARELRWKFRAPGEDAPLVDRYAFAAQVLPQLTQALRALEPGGVDRIVLCGPVPALRALAAPMIEELDVEVATLDGIGGVVFDADPDAAASAQLGAGAAVSGRDVSVIPGLGVQPVLTPVRVMLGAAAAAAVIVLVLLFWPAPQASKPRDGGVEGVREPVSRGSRA